MPAAEDHDVAIVGIGCRFPGGVDGPAAFWRLLTEGRDAIAEIPADRFDLARYFDPAPATPGRVMTRWGGFLDHIQDFDAAFFGISPREAERMDPQQRLALETAWEALEDAGHDALALRGSDTGVFIGQWLSDFEGRLFADPEAVDFYMTTGSGRYATSGRLSYLLGLQGPSLTVDTACSSSLVAVHLAVRALRAGECQQALAGGVNVILQPHITIAYSQSRMMAPDGRCKFGDAAGDGYVRSEGAGMLVLKTLRRAQADGDRIYAVIRGSAVNNDGQGSGSMGTPSREGQAALLRKAYADAGVPAHHLGYVEAHGTGTRAGDPVELGALIDVIGEGAPAAQARTRVGSVKTNIGHTEGAAGVAGLIKAALALHHGAIPPSLHCRTPNPAVDWAHAPIELAGQSTSWQGATRLAGISAFGIAGTNAHVVLQSASQREAAAAEPKAAHAARPALLPLSARSPEALRALAARYAVMVEGRDAQALRALCAATALKRAALEHRAAFVAHDAAAMAALLRDYAAGQAVVPEAVVPEAVVHAAPGGVAFVVPGQGAQWVGMGRALAAAEPVFRAALQACDHAASPWLEGSIVEQLALDAGAPGCRMDRIEMIQPVLLALSIAYARWLQSLGVVPQAVVGHSMGEVGAAHLAGVLSLDDAMCIICRRSALMAQTRGQGAMAMVELSMADAERRLAGRESLVSVAAHNSARASVISGEPRAVQQVLDELTAEGVFCRLVKVDVASHSPQMEGPAASLVAELQGLQPQPARLPICSTVLGAPAEGQRFDAGYWGANMRRPVLFAQGVERLLDAGCAAFVELGPHPVLAASIEQTVAARGTGPMAVVACGRRDEPESLVAMNMVAALWVHGHALDWRAVCAAEPAVEPLPTYPWQRERHWVREAAPAESRRSAGRALRLEARHADMLHALRWVKTEAAAPVPPLRADGPTAAPVLVVSDGPPHVLQSYAQAFEGAGMAARFVGLGAALALLRSASAGAWSAVLLLGEGGAPSPFGLVSVLQASCGTGVPLHVATVGAQVVGGVPQARADVDQGGLWGVGRVLAEEHPEQWRRLIDLDPSADAGGRAAQLVREWGAVDGEAQVALRGDQRYVLRLQPLDVAALPESPSPWSVDGAWLITGGLGGVPLQLAAGMVAQGARRLVLLGRTPLPPRQEWSATPADSVAGRRIAAVRALEAAGAAVHLLEADVGDPQSLSRALQQYEAAAYPPIRGVVHAAGVLDTRLALQTDEAAVQRVWAPKVEGARALDRLLPGLQRFVLVSSISGTLGFAGMAGYAAANAALDALAHDRRLRGLHAVSVQSGPWLDTGMHSGDHAHANMEQMRERGIDGFSPQDGVRLFSALVDAPETGVLLMPVDWVRFASARRGRDLRMYAACEGVAAGANPSTRGAGLADQLGRASVAERRKLLEPLVREAVAGVLKLAPARVDPRKALGGMGLNSLMAMELRNRLETLLARPLSATLAWNYPTVEALVGFLAGAQEVPTAAPAAVPVEATAPTLEITAVAQLSDEDAARALRRKR